MQLATAIDPSKANETANHRIDDILSEILDFEDISGRTSLHAALEQSQFECASVLLEENDVNPTVKNSSSQMLPLHVFLARDGILSHQGLLRRLLEAPANQDGDDAAEVTQEQIVNAPSVEKATPLMIAAGNAHLGSVRQVSSSFEFENDICQSVSLVEEDTLSSAPKGRRKSQVKKEPAPVDAIVKQVKVGEKEGDGGGASLLAGTGGSVGRKKASEFVVEVLMDRKADASLQDIHGCTALDYAARAGILSHVEFLCQQENITRVHIEHALFTTIASPGAYAGNVNVLKYLMLYSGSLTNGSSLTAKGMGPEFSGEIAMVGTSRPILGETALHTAARLGRFRCLQKLMHWMPDEAIYMKDSLGFTALARSMKLPTPSNSCANALVQRIIELARLPYKPAALVTKATIAARLEALNDPQSQSNGIVPHMAAIPSAKTDPSSENEKFLNSGAPSSSAAEQQAAEHTEKVRPESIRASAFPAESFHSPEGLDRQGNWSPSRQVRAEPNLLLSKFIQTGDAGGGQAAYVRLQSCLPFVHLDESLLYTEAEQDLLAPHLSREVLEAACNARNYDMVLQLVTLMPRLKDCIISDEGHRSDIDHTANHTHQGKTTLLCWAVRHRNHEIIARLLQLGVDVNAPEPGEGGLSALMICIKWLSKSRWASLAMESFVLGRDEPYIKVADLVLLLRMKKPEILSLADNLKDLAGNPAKSPTGRALFKRSPFRFSWYGFTAMCIAADPDLGSQMVSYAHEMEDYRQILNALIEHPETDLSLELGGQTASSIAAEGSNWKVLDALAMHGAKANDAALIEALAVHNHLDRLNKSLIVEQQSSQDRINLSVDRLASIFTKTCEAGHPECAAKISAHMEKFGVQVSSQHNLIEAVRHQQHWMIDFHIQTNSLRDEKMLGEAVLICTRNGDFRSLQKLLKSRANPNYGYSSSKGQLTSPLLIAGKLWSASGSETHYECIVSLLSHGADVRHADEAGHTILFWAATRGHKMLLRLALATSERLLCREEMMKLINKQDVKGRTALMLAVESMENDCVCKLLSYNADANLGVNLPVLQAWPCVSVCIALYTIFYHCFHIHRTDFITKCSLKPRQKSRAW